MDFSELEKARKIALYKVLCFSFLSFITAVVGLFFLIKYTHADNEGMAILVSVIALFVWSWIATSGETTASDFEIQVKEKLLPSVLKNIMQGRGKIKWCSHLDCYASKNNDKTYDLFQEDNCIPQEVFKGTYHNIKFTLSEYLEERGTGKSRHTLIRGNIIRIPTNIDYLGKIVIGNKSFFASQTWQNKIFSKTHKVPLGSAIVSGRSLFTDNPNSFDKILTPEFVGFVNGLSKKYYVVFINSDLYIIYSTSRDTFKMGSVWKKVDDPKQYARFETDLMEALYIVEQISTLGIGLKSDRK